MTESKWHKYWTQVETPSGRMSTGYVLSNLFEEEFGPEAKAAMQAYMQTPTTPEGLQTQIEAEQRLQTITGVDPTEITGAIGINVHNTREMLQKISKEMRG